MAKKPKVSSAKRKKAPASAASQGARFKETAKEIQADESGKAFEKAFGVIAAKKRGA